MIQKFTLAMIGAAAILTAQTTAPKTYASAEEATEALVKASAQGMDAIKAMLGPGSADIVRTGDPLEDQAVIERFRRLSAEKKTKLEADPMNPDRVTLLLGEIEWPMAVPLVRKNNRWTFDLKEGKAEVRRRVIGFNELDAIEICQGYVEAQHMYTAQDWNGGGVVQYARRIVSTEGKKDGLYWPGDESPVAAGFAKAAAQGYQAGGGYHGYFYKVLLAQGADAPGGAQDYVVHNLMIGGFALVAWPVEYGFQVSRRSS